MFSYSTSESENVGLAGLVSDNPFVFNLSKTFLVPVIIKLPFRVVLSALCTVWASVCGHSALMITRITVTALVARDIRTTGKQWSRHSNLLALKPTLAMISLSWLALCGDKVPLKAACVDVCSLSLPSHQWHSATLNGPTKYSMLLDTFLLSDLGESVIESPTSRLPVSTSVPSLDCLRWPSDCTPQRSGVCHSRTSQ